MQVLLLQHGRDLRRQMLPTTLLEQLLRLWMLPLSLMIMIMTSAASGARRTHVDVDGLDEDEDEAQEAVSRRRQSDSSPKTFDVLSRFLLGQPRQRGSYRCRLMTHWIDLPSG